MSVARVLAILWIVYTAYYLCRMHLPVALPLISTDLSVEYGDLGVVIGTFYAMYSVGLIVNGILLVNRPYWSFLLIGGLGSGLTSIIISQVKNYVSLLILWALNGYLQASGWPSVVGLTTKVVPRRVASIGYGFISTSWSLGHAIVWWLSVWLTNMYGWRYCFLINGLVLIGVSVALIPQLRGVSNREGLSNRLRLTIKGITLYTTFIALLHIICYGVRYLLINYLPTYLSYGSSSIPYTILIVPIFGSIGMVAIAPIFNRLSKPYKPLTSGILALLSALLLYLFLPAYADNTVLGLAILALHSAILYGNEAQITTLLPVMVTEPKLSPLMAGLIDSLGSIGAALSGFTGGLYLERGIEGFKELVTLWSVVLALAIIPSILACKTLLHTTYRRTSR